MSGNEGTSKEAQTYRGQFAVDVVDQQGAELGQDGRLALVVGHGGPRYLPDI